MILTKKAILGCVWLFIIITLILSSNSARATDYYFSNAGSDAAAGTSTSTAWASIAKFNTMFATRLPGDNFYFRRGDTFYGSLSISRSGSSGLPMTISAYGTGAKPIITGFTTVSAWTNLGSNIWESVGAVTTLSVLNMVAINGVNTPMGRYPNTGYLTYTSPTATTKTVAGLPSSTTNWTGAIAVIRAHHWITNTDAITGHSGTILTHSVTPITTTYNGISGYGLFIQNDARTLDTQNEWYFNPSTKKLRIFSSSSPTGVKVATIDTLVTMGWNRGFITFDNISFIGSNKDHFVIKSCPSVTIQNCQFDFAGKDVIWGAINGGSPFSPNFIFDNNSVNHTNNNVLNLREEFTNALIKNNTINNTALFPGMGASGEGSYLAMKVFGAGSIIEYNTIDSTGYIPIHFLGNNIITRFNFISQFNRTKMDGGAIYTWLGSATEHTGCKIYNNIIIDAPSSTAGTNQTTALAHGIYLDANTENVEVYNNSVSGMAYGGAYIYSGSSNNNFHDNTFYNNGHNQILFANQYSNGKPTLNNTMTNNIYFSRTSTQYVLKVTTRDALSTYTSAMGTFTNNYYARPIDDATSTPFFLISNNNGTFNNWNLTTWKTNTSNDVGSLKSPKTITDVNDLRFEYNATSSSVTIALPFNYMDVKGVTYNGSITLQPYTSAVLIKNGAVIVTSAGKYYFSSSTGNDATGTGTISAPYASLTKLNSVFATSSAGDSFLLKRGDTFYGFIIAGRSGTASLPMVIAPYGSGADPIVTGFTTISGWTNVGGGIWESATTTALLPFLNMVVVDGVNTGMGRWPDANADGLGGWNTFESFVGTTSITDAQLSTTPFNWTGAELVLKPQHWLINRSIITSHVGGTLSSVEDQQPRSGGYGYFIQNDIRTLTKFGEWYHYKSPIEKIRMYFGSELPSAHVIQAATVDSLLYISGKSYIAVSNINFRGANGNAIRTIGSGQTGVTFDSITIQFAGIDGITIWNTLPGFRFTNSSVMDCNNSCIMATNTTDAVITGNYVRNSYMIPGMGGERDGMGYGIRVGAGGLIEYNSIINSGNNATYFSGDNSIIRNNFIDSFCIIKDDGGGINSGLTSGYVAQTGRKLYNNIILNGRGNNDGTPSVEFAVRGIYLDDNINGVEAKGNTIANNRGEGIFLHNNRDVILRNNTIYNNGISQINILDDNIAGSVETQGLRIAGNIMATVDKLQSTLELEDNLDDIGGFGSLDSNIYANLLTGNTSITLGRNSLAVIEHHDLASWRTRFAAPNQEDLNGVYSSKVVKPYRDLVIVGSNKFFGGCK